MVKNIKEGKILKKTIVYVIAIILLVLIATNNSSNCREISFLDCLINDPLINPKIIQINTCVQLTSNEELASEISKYLLDVAYAELKNKLPSTIQIQKSYIKYPDFYISIDVFMADIPNSKDYYFGRIKFTKEYSSYGVSFIDNTIEGLLENTTKTTLNNFSEWLMASHFNRIGVEVVFGEFIFVNYKKDEVKASLKEDTEELIMKFVKDFYDNQDRIELEKQHESMNE
jgi:hypothetical protein